MFKDKLMNKVLRTIGWTYIVMYTANVMLAEAMDIITENATYMSFISSLALLFPPYVVGQYLRGKWSNYMFSVIGLVALLAPISDAHKFLTMEHVTLLMYLLLVPMLAMLVYVNYRKVSE